MKRKLLVNVLVAGAVTSGGMILSAPACAGGGSSQTPAPARTSHQVTMTWISGYHRYATIDGTLYAVGSTLPDGARVVAIQKGSVTLFKDNKRQNVKMVDAPPDNESSAAGTRGLTPLSYLDEAIAELDRAIAARSGQPGAEAQVEKLRHLRDRLDAARERLADNKLSPGERRELKGQISRDWLQSQVELDALRRQILGASGEGLSIDQLRLTQNALEGATLEALRKPLAELAKQPGFEELAKGESSSSLLEAATALLGSYPDYQALADRLDQIEKGQSK
jgi:hypothetical protein